MSLISLWYSSNDKTQTIIANKKVWFENHYELCQINPTTMITMMLQKVGRVQVVTIQLWERCFLCQPCSGDKLHRASYSHNKLLHLVPVHLANPTAQFVTKSPLSGHYDIYVVCPLHGFTFTVSMVLHSEPVSLNWGDTVTEMLVLLHLNHHIKLVPVKVMQCGPSLPTLVIGYWAHRQNTLYLTTEIEIFIQNYFIWVSKWNLL